MMGFRVFLNGTPVIVKSLMQKHAAASVCKAELYGAYEVAKEMLYA